MARSPFTLAAAVTAALPGAEVTGTRALTAAGDGRFDSAVASLADGRELAIRVAIDEEGGRELSSEALALRALTTGARAILPFRAPEYIGETRLDDAGALVTEMLSGFQIEAGFVPAGRGAAHSMGAAIAAIHTLPASVVRSAGLTARTAAEAREEVAEVVDRAGATGRVPARLMVRWREAVADDELWSFESTVTLGGAQATSFLFEDDDENGPTVIGVVGWHGLSIGDPAVDLAWLSTAVDAAADVHAAYTRAADRGADDALGVRARLLAELEFARWLVHGDALRRSDIVEDAAGLLESLSDGLREDDLMVIAERESGVDSAMDALGRVPAAVASADTSMQTDAYNPEDLWSETTEAPDGAASVADAVPLPRSVTPEGSPWVGAETEDLAEIHDSGLFSDSDAGSTSGAGTSDVDSAEEAQRAARAALQRWKRSSSE